MSFTYDLTYDLEGFESGNAQCEVTFSKVNYEIEFTETASETQAKLKFFGVVIEDVTITPENDSTRLLRNEVCSELRLFNLNQSYTLTFLVSFFVDIHRARI